MGVSTTQINFYNYQDLLPPLKDFITLVGFYRENPITNKKNDQPLEIGHNELILKKPSEHKEIFFRDCYFLCKNFFAKESKIEIDDYILNKLKTIQPDKKENISDHAIFGLRKDGSANCLENHFFFKILISFSGEMELSFKKLLH